MRKILLNDKMSKFLLAGNSNFKRLFLTFAEVRANNVNCLKDLDQSVKKCADLRSQAAEANGRLLRCQQKHASGMYSGGQLR